MHFVGMGSGLQMSVKVLWERRMVWQRRKPLQDAMGPQIALSPDKTGTRLGEAKLAQKWSGFLVMVVHFEYHKVRCKSGQPNRLWERTLEEEERRRALDA